MPTGFPSIIPGARFDVDAWALDGGSGVDQVGGWREPFIREGEYLRAKEGRDQVLFVSRLAPPQVSTR